MATSNIPALILKTFLQTGINKSFLAKKIGIPKTTFLATVRGDKNYNLSIEKQRLIKRELLHIIKKLQLLADKLPS